MGMTHSRRFPVAHLLPIAFVCVLAAAPAMGGGVAILNTVLSDNGDDDGWADTRETVKLLADDWPSIEDAVKQLVRVRRSFEPDPERRALYAKGFEVYRGLYEANADLTHAISAFAAELHDLRKEAE